MGRNSGWRSDYPMGHGRPRSRRGLSNFREDGKKQFAPIYLARSEGRDVQSLGNPRPQTPDGKVPGGRLREDCLRRDRRQDETVSGFTEEKRATGLSGETESQVVSAAWL